ncbi:hypothetical protein [Sphingomonas koreensis]
MDIQLNFINRSDDTNNSRILIFGKNPETSLDEIAKAWIAIPALKPNTTHAVLYTAETGLTVQDSYGNFTPMQPATPGEHFRVVAGEGGHLVEPAITVGPADQITLANDLMQGAVNACLYKDGHLYLSERNVVPGQTAAFRLRPVIWLAVASETDPDAGSDSAILSSVATEISLLGLASADVVMTGGGSGANAEPLDFTLENIVAA